MCATTCVSVHGCRGDGVPCRLPGRCLAALGAPPRWALAAPPSSRRSLPASPASAHLASLTSRNSLSKPPTSVPGGERPRLAVGCPLTQDAGDVRQGGGSAGDPARFGAGPRNPTFAHIEVVVMMSMEEKSVALVPRRKGCFGDWELVLVTSGDGTRRRCDWRGARRLQHQGRRG